ncbi:helix-turn-helix transcriptional regulator [Amycolatopsis antarctica]|uniref:Helix-turn-helix transcriptional regulator n=1 Tax=Amycolatopsis antarctica TaxID=1854586 RepID=A0A263CZW4_9PSEU|nr:LuxR C-terminal-related transcriptional regulator [Amycolatopsis antarctica]OZM70836.1 helix-turn-helix transcriptional regulator [Amycolatopsis antarctica]
MEPVDVAIEATDMFSKEGLASQLSSRSEVRVVDRAEMTGSGVIIVAVDRLSAREVAFIRQIEATPAVPKLLVTDASAESAPRAVADCGVAALLARADATPDRLVGSILATAKAKDTDSGSGSTGILAMETVRVPTQPDRGTDGLSSREVDVLTLMADGLDTLGIATRLCYSERTVKNVIYELTSRFKLRSRPHAVAYAMRAGLI